MPLLHQRLKQAIKAEAWLIDTHFLLTGQVGRFPEQCSSLLGLLHQAKGYVKGMYRLFSPAPYTGVLNSRSTQKKIHLHSRTVFETELIHFEATG